MSEQERKRIAANPIFFMRWILDNIEAGHFTMADVKGYFETKRTEADLSEFEATASEAWEGWEE